MSTTIEYRRLGDSGLKVPALTFGAVTFGGGAAVRAWGDASPEEARRIVDICIDSGITMFDTADGYSDGRSEEMLAAAIGDRRDEVLISTKASLPMGWSAQRPAGPNDGGSSRFHLTQAVEASLRRLKTDHIDLLYMHFFDGTTPVEETMQTLDDLVRAGKVRYIGASNFPAWVLMKSLVVADRRGSCPYVAHQVQYSLAVRDYEHELAPLGKDQGVGATVWSPLAQGALTGKIRRDQPAPSGSRVAQGIPEEVPTQTEKVYEIVDVLDEIASETGHSLSQIALNWLLCKPTVSSLVIGARTEEQLRDNIGALGWALDADQVARLDAASAVPAPYPHSEYHRELFDFMPSDWTERGPR